MYLVYCFIYVVIFFLSLIFIGAMGRQDFCPTWLPATATLYFDN